MTDPALQSIRLEASHYTTIPRGIKKYLASHSWLTKSDEERISGPSIKKYSTASKCKVGVRYRRNLMVVSGNSPVSLCTDHHEIAYVQEVFFAALAILGLRKSRDGLSHLNGKLHLISQPWHRRKEASVCTFLP